MTWWVRDAVVLLVDGAGDALEAALEAGRVDGTALETGRVGIAALEAGRVDAVDVAASGGAIETA
jgi:hypothetical protein